MPESAKNSIEFISHDSLGELVIASNGKRYTYYDISPYQAEHVKEMIRAKKFGKLWQFLKQFSRGDLYETLS